MTEELKPKKRARNWMVLIGVAMLCVSVGGFAKSTNIRKADCWVNLRDWNFKVHGYHIVDCLFSGKPAIIPNRPPDGYMVRIGPFNADFQK